MNFVIRGRHLQFALLVAGLLIALQDVRAQQPTPSPTPHTGRSYSTDELPKTPPPPGPNAPSTVTFTDITAATKIAFKHAGSPTSLKYLLETMGGGVAIFDYDNDGRMDLFFTNGALLKDPMPKGAMPDKSDPKFWNRLYHQKADGTFEDVTERAGLKGEGFSMGVATGDYDNDGFVDLYVTGYDEPEGYAIAKDSKMYYAFFTSANWKGEVDLRGLKAGKYRVSDYSEGKDLGTVDAAANGVAKLAAEFKDHLLLEVSSQP